MNQLDTLPIEGRAGTDEECIVAFSLKSSEGGIDLASTGCIQALVKLARDRYLRFRTLMDGSRSTTNDGLFSPSPEAVVGKMAIGVSYLTHCRMGLATS